jgi:hypothetical protein
MGEKSIQARRPSLHRKSNVIPALTGFFQLSRHGPGAGWTCACAHEHDAGVKLGIVRFRMLLVPSPIAKRALVNEGEGLRFVCHIEFDAETEGMLTLRKYSVRGAFETVWR